MEKIHNYIVLNCDHCNDTSFYDYLLLKKNMYGRYLKCGVCGKTRYIFETMIGEFFNKIRIKKLIKKLGRDYENREGIYRIKNIKDDLNHH